MPERDSGEPAFCLSIRLPGPVALIIFDDFNDFSDFNSGGVHPPGQGSRFKCGTYFHISNAAGG
jgi:hypothetical protein